MPLTFSSLAVVVLVELSILTLLWLRFERGCLGGYQPRATIQPVPENEPLESNAVADALLMLAVAKHVKSGDIRRHIELAQVAKEEMASGIECGAMEQAARDEFIKILKNKKA